MFARIERLTVTLMIAAILASLVFVSMPLVAMANGNGSIDVFSQKEPFSGKGFNVSSDAFAPGENVILYANVMYNGYGVFGDLVAFEVQGPANPIANITLFYSAMTNGSGIATVSFGIPEIASEVIGYWRVVANVREPDILIQDFLSFRVGWIVEITSIVTMNLNHTIQDKFTRNSHLITELTVKSISMTEKLATLTVTINDSRSKPVDSVELSDFVVLPNETLVYAYPELFIPGNASIGVATAFACAFTEPVSGKGIPYCPQVSTHFAVTTPLAVHDIVVLSLSPSANVVSVGDIVSVNVKVKNQGNFTESFNVTAFYDSHTIGMIFINDMPAGINETLVFHWLTQDVEVDNYTLSVSAGPVAGEKNLANNYFTDGVVSVRAPGPLIVHDIAVVNVVPASTFANIGDTLNVNVTVKNKGTATESFNVILYYSQNVIGSLRVSNLASGSQTAVTFHWSTGSVTAGTYNLTAFAVPVAGETSIVDNYFEDGSVKLAQSPRGFFATWFFWLLLLLLIALLILVPLLWFYYRRRKRDQESFATGWTAWYYGTDLLCRSTSAR